MSVRRMIVLTMLLALAALVASGCMGGRLSKDEYQKELDKIGKTLDKQGKIFCDPGSLSDKTFEEAADSLDGASEDLDELSPPENIEESHDEMVEALAESADLFRGDIKDAFLA